VLGTFRRDAQACNRSGQDALTKHTPSSLTDGPNIVVGGSGSQDPEPPRPLKRRRRWICLALAIALAAWFSHFAYLRITRRPTPRPEYWQAQIAQLDPPGEGAISAAEAYKFLYDRPTATGYGSPWRNTEYTVRMGPWDDDRPDIVAADALFASAQYDESRAELRDVVRAGWLEPLEPRQQGPYMPVHPHRAWGTSLLAHSRWSRERGEGMATAVEDWLLALRLARQLRRPQTASNLLGAFSMTSQVAWEITYTAREPHGPVDTRSLAEDIHRISGPPKSPSKLLEGQRLYMHILLERMYVRQDGDWLVVSESSAAFPNWSGTDPPSAPRMWNLTSPLFHDLPTARRRVDEYFAVLDEFADLVAYAASREYSEHFWDEIRPGILDGMYAQGVRRGVFGAIDRVIYYQHDARCRMEAAVTMLALYEHHREYGRYPDQLDELVPKHLPRLPIDYADHATLRYRRQADDYILYGVGSDGQDDGGKIARPWPTHPEGTDAVYSRAKREEFDRW